MITSIKKYVPNTSIRGIFEKDMILSRRIALPDPIHMMSMADLVAISVKTPRIESECSLEKDFNELV